MKKLKFLISKGLKIVLNPPALRKCKVNRTSKICSGSELNNVVIGKYSYVGNRCFMNRVQIGNFCSIADRCFIGGATHPIERVSSSPVFHIGKNVMRKNFANFPEISTPTTYIENDVWIGAGTYIKAGVTIHNGAVIGMGSVVTKDVPAYEIWAGNPAKKIKDRFNIEKTEQLQNIKWWEWNDERIKANSCLFNDIEIFINSNRGTNT